MRARVRALLIALFLATQAVVACPVPRRIGRDDLADRATRADLDRWAATLRSLGFETTRARLGRWLVRASSAVVDAHDSINVPLPWARLLRGTQRFSLFSRPSQHPYRLVIEGRTRAADWVLLYRALDPAHDLFSGPIEDRRVRAAYNPSSGGTSVPASYERFARWIAMRILAERADLVAVRIGQERFHVALPGEPVDPRTQTRFKITHRRPR